MSGQNIKVVVRVRPLAANEGDEAVCRTYAAGADAFGAWCGRARPDAAAFERGGEKIAFSRAFYARDLVGGV